MNISDFYSVRLYSITRLRQFITMYTQPLLDVVSVYGPRSLALTPSSFLNRLRITLAVWPPVHPRWESHPESPRSLIQVPICPLEVKRESGGPTKNSIKNYTWLDITYLSSSLRSQTFSSTGKKMELINYTMRWQNTQTSNTLITQVQDFCAEIIDIFATLMPNRRGAWAWPLSQCSWARHGCLSVRSFTILEPLHVHIVHRSLSDGFHFLLVKITWSDHRWQTWLEWPYRESNKESRFWYWGHKTNKAPCPSGDLTTNISSFNTATLWLLQHCLGKLWDNFTE